MITPDTATDDRTERWTLACDYCEHAIDTGTNAVPEDGYQTQREAQDAAETHGWVTIRDDVHLCGECKQIRGLIEWLEAGRSMLRERITWTEYEWLVWDRYCLWALAGSHDIFLMTTREMPDFQWPNDGRWVVLPDRVTA